MIEVTYSDETVEVSFDEVPVEVGAGDVIQLGGTGGSFDGVHNDIDGRDDADAHPYASITGAPIMADYIVRGAVNRSTWTASYPVADLTVVLAGQATSSENGLYTTTTGGALDVASRVDIFTMANLSRPVFGYVVSPGTPNALYTYIDSGLYDATATRNALAYTIGLVDGGGIGLVPAALDPDTVADLAGRAFALAMGDYVISEDTTLTLNHNVVVFNGQTEAITITLAPHATKVRHAWLWNKGDYDVELEQHPVDSTPFAYTLEPGQRALILPDQNAWDVWHIPPHPEAGDAGKVLVVTDDETGYKLETRPTADDITTAIGDAVAEAIGEDDLASLVGTIDCSEDPNWPEADAGDVYRVEFPGKIGGTLGPTVAVGDLLTCWVDGSAAGTNAAVGEAWTISADGRLRPTVARTGAYADLTGKPTLGTAAAEAATAFATAAQGATADAALPGSILVQYGLNGSYTTGTAISHFSYSLPVLAAGDFIEVEASIEWNNTTGSNVAFAPNLVLGSTVMTSTTTLSLSTGTTRQMMVRARLYIISTSSQSCDICTLGSASGLLAVGTGVATESVGTAGVALSLRTSTNNASAGAKLRFATIRRSRV